MYSDENVLQSCGAFLSVFGSVDGLSPGWGTWAVANPNLQGWLLGWMYFVKVTDYRVCGGMNDWFLGYNVLCVGLC